MATIEPRLIHLLNDSQSPHLSHPDLPALQTLSLPQSSARLPPLEPDASHHGEDGPSTLSSSKSLPALYRAYDEPLPNLARKDDLYTDRTSSSTVPSSSLRLILDESDSPDPLHPLRQIFDEHSASAEDLTSKKRHHGLTGKEDTIHLPQPLKKQKSSGTIPIQAMPPIIQGLHDPPPNAAVFPPIASNSFDNPEALKISLLRDFPARSDDKTATLSPISDGDKGASGKPKRRAAKPRRKWSEEETKHLLLGVHKHGVGRWTDILEDTEFHFNDRTAGDLKDRFRTCCPDELRNKKEKDKDQSPTTPFASEPKSKAPGPLHIESILEPEETSKPPSPVDHRPGAPKRKSRAHRKNMDDLAELGIHTPFKKSLRRERRPFSEQDDKEILEGFKLYGPAWTKIQRDPRFHLSNRQATDLRDRLRNKRPDLFASSSKAHLKEAGKCGPLEPSVNIGVENTFNMPRSSASVTPLNRINSKEDIPKWSYQSTEPAPPMLMDWNEPNGPHPYSASLNDMGISRLLLDDSHVHSDPRRIGIDSLSNTSSPAGGISCPQPSRGEAAEKRPLS